jgi:formylglycine-generating enzyme required for sulfatase activity
MVLNAKVILNESNSKISCKSVAFFQKSTLKCVTILIFGLLLNKVFLFLMRFKRFVFTYLCLKFCKSMIYKRLLWLLCLWNVGLAHGQVVFSNVRITSSAGVITVCYDVQPTNDRVLLKAIRLTVLRDGDDGQPPLRITPKSSHTQGAIGTNVSFGVGQCIVWRCKQGGYIFKETIGVDLEADYTLQEAPCEPETVLVEGGTFMMGSESETPIHKVTLSSFRMGKYEITVKQFRCFIESSGYQTDAEKYGDSWVYANGSWSEKKGVTWKCDVAGTVRPLSEENHPVIHVSWNDATAYCQWLSKKTGKTYRLPTEAEWEYAAKGGRLSQNYKYSGSNELNDVAWNLSNSDTKTHVVGGKRPNELGLYDLSGNVWEWCQDWYDSYSSNAIKNPKGAATGSHRVYRGGSWGHDSRYCRSSYRHLSTPAYRHDYMGFRLLVLLQ